MLNNKKLQNQFGLTLIELLAALTIFAIISGVLFGVLNQSFKQSDITRNHIDLRQEANLIISKLRQLHQGDNYNLCYENGKIYLDSSKSDSLANEGITLKGVANDSNVKILFENNGSFIKETNNVLCSSPLEIDTSKPLFVSIVLIDEDEDKFEINTTIDRLSAVEGGIMIPIPGSGTDPRDGGGTEPTNPGDSGDSGGGTTPGLINENVFVYGSSFEFQGSSVVGNNATLIIKGNLDTSKLNGGAAIQVSNIIIDGSLDLNGGSAAIGHPTMPGKIIITHNFNLWSGTRNIYGDVYVGGNFYIKDAIIHGNVYVDGDVEINWTPQIKENARIYYTGNLKHPASMSSSITSKFIKTDSIPKVEIPNYSLPSLKSDQWYANNGYSNSLSVNSAKIFDNNVNISIGQNHLSGSNTFNAIIVSKGDINVRVEDWNHTLSGILFAPNGKVTFTGREFKGIVISKYGFVTKQGGSTIVSKPMTDFFNNPDQYPFE